MFSHVKNYDGHSLAKIMIEYIEKGNWAENLNITRVFKLIHKCSEFEKQFIFIEVQDELRYLYKDKSMPLENLKLALKYSAITAFIITVAEYARSQNIYSSLGAGVFTGGATFFGMKKYIKAKAQPILLMQEQRILEILNHSEFQTIRIPGIKINDVPASLRMNYLKDKSFSKMEIYIRRGTHFSRQEIASNPNFIFNPISPIHPHGVICESIKKAYRDFENNLNRNWTLDHAREDEKITFSGNIKGQLYGNDVNIKFNNIEEYLQFVNKYEWPIPADVALILKNSYFKNGDLLLREIKVENSVDDTLRLPG